MKKSEKNKRQNYRNWIISFIIIILIGIAYFWVQKYYDSINMPNVSINKKFEYLYIKTASNYEDVLQTLKSKNIIIDIESFEWMVEKKNYKSHIYPGRYKIANNISNDELINILRSGVQEPIKLIFNNIRTLEQFSGRISEQIEADSIEIIKFLSKKENISKYGFNNATIVSLFIPNTYKIYWNISVANFVERMAKEYKKFWNY